MNTPNPFREDPHASQDRNEQFEPDKSTNELIAAFHTRLRSVSQDPTESLLEMAEWYSQEQINTMFLALNPDLSTDMPVHKPLQERAQAHPAMWPLYLLQTVQHFDRNTFGSLSQEEKRMVRAARGSIADFQEASRLVNLRVTEVPWVYEERRAAVAALQDFTDLKSLSLENEIIGNGEIQALRGMALERLNLMNARGVTGEGLEALSGMPLQHLSASGVTDAQLAQVFRFMPLEHLEILSPPVDRWGDITDLGLRHISKLTLKILSVTSFNGEITDAGLESLKDMPLESLALCNTSVRGRGFKELQSAPLSELFLLNATELDDSAVEPLKGLKDLKKLSIWGRNRLSEAAKAELQASFEETVFYKDILFYS